MGSVISILLNCNSKKNMNPILDRVTVKHTQEKGRCLISDRDFDEDSTILVEQPFVSAQFLWNAAYGYTACGHCMRSLETTGELCCRLLRNENFTLPRPELCPRYNQPPPVNCPNCKVLYCSMECRDTASETYHRILCLNDHNPNTSALLRLQELWRNMHYPPETASIMMVARSMATVIQAEDPRAEFEKFQKLCHISENERENIALKFLGEEYEKNIELLRLTLSDPLNCEYTEEWFTKDGFAALFALVATNGQGIGTSSLSEWTKACNDLDLPKEEEDYIQNFIDNLYDDLDKEIGQFLNSEGSGLYALQSSANHSCVPNAECTFPNNDFTLVLKALQPIKKGEEICISYLTECQLNTSRHSRVKFLRMNYLFNCRCQKCNEQINDEDCTSDEEEDMSEEEEDMADNGDQRVSKCQGDRCSGSNDPGTSMDTAGDVSMQ